jgi:hypothetical protein
MYIDLKSVSFANASFGVAVSGYYSTSTGPQGLILVTYDGGQRWITRENVSSTYLAGVFLLNETTGWIV